MLFSFSSQKRLNPEGSWRILSKGETSYVELLKDGRLRFSKEGKSFLPADAAFRYKFNFDEEPARLDILIFSLYGDKLGVLEGLVSIKDKDNFTFKYLKDSRPSSLNDVKCSEAEFSRLK
jgi:hypothetical protein